MANHTSDTLISYRELEQEDAFVHRHIGPTPADIESMLASVGATSLQDLIEQTVPNNILRGNDMEINAPMSEASALAKIKGYADQNQVFKSYIGMGYHNSYTPGVIQRNVLENPGWYTAYTPYQPEISQGRLEALLNYQQMVMDLTGMELANASLLDEGTAAAEAMALCKRMIRKNKSNTFFVADHCHPQTIAVVQTRAEHLEMDVVVAPLAELNQHDVFGALMQYPASNGEIVDIKPAIDTLHANNALAVVASDLLALTLLTPPGELGADVVVGNSQRFGVPMGFGGPHAAFFATREQYKRSAPGRIIGVSIDRYGNTAYRMAMQTREQHIRREKATSNICTSQALLAIMAAFYAIYHGPKGLTTIAQRVNRLANTLATGLKDNAIELANSTFFDTVCFNSGAQHADILARAESAKVNLRALNDNQISVSLDETSSADDVFELLKIITNKDVNITDMLEQAPTSIPADAQRSSAFLTHAVFNSHASETDMLRYMRLLESKDIALNHSMIALGSCTMKLNATAEMIPITWPEFANMHPFAPKSQTKGYQAMLNELEQMLVQATGYDAMSLQPNAGSQGEYAGLLTIKRYYQAQGQSQRNICLIPQSAHGTNPASAAMASMKVVIVACDDKGNVDIADLRAKAERHSNELAAIMITYPSTHGVFEEGITEICQIIHEHGGQVYLDGANMNALVGVAAPGQFGADVSHLNLHKTFAIPHGGGGPGMGPIGVKAHLAEHLPSHPVMPVHSTAGNLSTDNDTISAAPYGSAGILPIPWMYISMMGNTGLTKATQVAMLSANYITKRLSAHYPVLFTGRNDRVAHECIIDLRPLKETSGITEEDIAKRLVDYGFHAPTMSFPVPGTLMIEPTESEPLSEIDRFCDAMISIRNEVRAVETGELDQENNPLTNAPHTAQELCGDEWTHPYGREQAAYPVAGLRLNKYWPPVGRIDNVYGDRNLFCACPAIESYES
jgi:glycine dehydrogenase